MNININSSCSPTKFSQPANLTTYTIWSLFSLQAELAPRLLSRLLENLHLPHYKSPTRFFNMHHITGAISSLCYSVNLILFTLLLVHLILRASPHHSHHLRSQHLSIPWPFTPGLKFTVSFPQILSSTAVLVPFRLPSQIPDSDRTYWALMFVYVLVSCLIFLVSCYVYLNKLTIPSVFQCMEKSLHCIILYHILSSTNQYNLTQQIITMPS